MAAKKEDRRIKKTKQLLRNGLIELMGEKELKSITVKELVERVDINRSTFYLHYTDVYQLLAELESSLTDEIWEIFELYKDVHEISDCTPFFKAILDAIDRNRALCKVLMKSKTNFFLQSLDDSIELELRRKLKEIMHNHDIFEESDVIFFKSGSIGLIRNWIINEMPFTPEEMAIKIYTYLVQFCEMKTEIKE